MATYTSKLNLKKPLGTEHVSRQDMNDNYDKIDAGVVTNVDGEISNSLLIGTRSSQLSTIGQYSIAHGTDVAATGKSSYACGRGPIATAEASHAEGSYTNATGFAGHAEGHMTFASGQGSHAEGTGTHATKNYSHAEGYETIASANAQHVGGKYNVEDTSYSAQKLYGTYAEIIGNGTGTTGGRSNARALDWDGNEYLKGDLYVGCNADSTGGTKVPTTPFSGASSSTAGSAGLVPAPSAGDQDKFLAGDGIWKVPSGGSDMTGATESTAGTHGLVPAPAAGDQNKVLKGDGTWGEMDVSGKADKVSGATNGNFAGLDSNGNLTDSEVGPEDLLQLDSELEDGTKAAPADVVGQLALMKADHIYEETESAPIASITDGAGDVPLKKLEVAIDPVQDLHGYDSPWPAGGGANKIPFFSNETQNVVTLTNNNGVITLNGTATAVCRFDLTLETPIPAGSYYASFFNDAMPGVEFIMLNSGGSGVSDIVLTSANYGSAITLGSDVVKLRIYIANGTSISSKKISPMLVSGSTAPTTFTPYSNVCPISGWDSANVSRTGVNVWDEEWEVGGLAGGTGLPYYADDRIRSKNYCPCKSETGYYLINNASGVYLYVWWYDANKTFISTVGGSSQVVTAPAGACFFKLSTYSGNYTTYDNDFGLNYPSTDTQYHAYSGSTTEYEFPTEAGTVYGGSLTIHQDGSGELVAKRWYKKTTWGEGGQATSPTDGFIRKRYEMGISNKYPSTIPQICNVAPYAAAFNQFYLHFYVNDDSNAFVFLPENTPSDLEIEISGELATPVTYQLTNQQVIALLKGSNNIWADTGDVALEYPADTKLYIDGKVAELQALILENISNS